MENCNCNNIYQKYYSNNTKIWKSSIFNLEHLKQEELILVMAEKFK